jgi:chromosome partitioning protein
VVTPSPGAASPSPGATTTRSRRAERDPGSAPLDVEVPEKPGTARVIAIANQKGGVGKSTTAVSLGAALADLGYRVLVVDLDPQGNASTGMGIRHEARDVTVYDVVVGDAALMDAVIPTPVPRLSALPSTIDLAGAEIELVSQFSRENRLKRSLEPVRHGYFDFVFLDCPPSLGLLTINALTAAEELIVPIQCEYYALEGLGQLLRNVSLVQQNINPGLGLTGIVMTMFDPRTKLSEQVVAEVQRFFGELMYDVVIPRTVRLSEAPGFGQPITVYDPKSKGAESYRALAREVALRPPPEVPIPSYDDLPMMVVPAARGEEPSDEGSEETTLSEVPTVREIIEEEPVEGPVAGLADRSTTGSSEANSGPANSGPANSGPANSGPANGGPAPEAASATAKASVPSASGTATTKPPAPPTTSVPAPEPRSNVPNGRPRRAASDEEIWAEGQDESEIRVRPVRIETSPGRPPERRVVVIDDATEPADATPPALAVGSPRREAGEKEDSATIGSTLRDEDGGKRRWRLFRKGGT